MLAPREIRIVVGISGSGKSMLTHEMLFDFDRVIVVDPKHEYTEGPAFSDWDALVDYVSTRERYIAVWRGGNLCSHKLAARAGSKAPNDLACAGFVDHLAHLALAVGDVCLVLEEATNFDMPEESWFEEAVLRTGRNRRVHFLATSQRPHLIHVNLRSQANRIVAFCTKEPSSLQWARSVFGDAVHELATLPRWHALDWNWDSPNSYSHVDMTPR